MRSVSHFVPITTYRSCWILVITDQIQTKPHVIFSTSHYERNTALVRTVVQQDMRIAFVLSEGDAAVNHVQQLHYGMRWQVCQWNSVLSGELREHCTMCMVKEPFVTSANCNYTLRDFKLPPRCEWGLCSSGLFRRLYWWLVKDVSAQPIGPTFKGQVVQEERPEHKGAVI